VEPLLRHGLWITIGVALVARLLHLWNVRANDPLYAQAFPDTDMRTYWDWAKAIQGGDLLSSKYGVFYYGPLYPYFLAAVFAVFGPKFGVVHGIHALVGLVAPALAFLTARRLFGSAEALAAGLLTALCAPFLLYEQTLLMEGLLLAIHAAILWCVVTGQDARRRAWMYAAAAGFLSGVACLGRGNFLLVIPLLAGVWVLVPWLMPDRAIESAAPEPVDAPARRRGGISRLVPALAFVLAASVVLGTSLARNRFVGGRWVLTTGNGPILFYIGNAYDSYGVFHYPDSFEKLKQKYGGDQGAVPWGKELRSSVLGHPGNFLKLMGRKAAMFISSYDVADNISYYLNRRFSWVFGWNPLNWTLIVPLGALGAWVTRRSWRRQIFLHVYALGFAASIIAVFVVGRYRLQFLLPLLLWAGAGVCALVRAFWQGQVARAGGMAVAVTLLAVSLMPQWSPGARVNTPLGVPRFCLVRSNDYVMLARAYQVLKQKDKTMSVLAEAAEQHPWDRPVTGRYAAMLTEAKRPLDAAGVLQKYLSYNGRDIDAGLHLASVLAMGGRQKDALAILHNILRVDPENATAKSALKNLETAVPGAR
jgi:4-amino-4-deoxy-L-arabinose transferase-like glycosyltransferase